MKKRVGIPRALMYYIYGVWWIKFFELIGADVVISPPTNKHIQELATLHAPDEDCYSVKLFYGHVLVLKEKVDYLFIPRFGSDHPVHVGCPKVLALPEILKATHPELPFILMPYYSRAKAHHGKIKLIQRALEVGWRLTHNPFRILRALWKSYHLYLTDREKKYLTLSELDAWEQSKMQINDVQPPNPTDPPLKVALCGHKYILNDSYASIDIKKKLLSMGLDVITSEQLPRSLIQAQMKQLDYNLYFEYEREILGSIMHYLTHPGVDGIIQITIFTCGPDSIGGEVASRWARRHPSVPFLQLVFDEHTGEAGLNTRLEAFVDLIKRRKKLYHLPSLTSVH